MTHILNHHLKIGLILFFASFLLSLSAITMASEEPMTEETPASGAGSQSHPPQKASTAPEGDDVGIAEKYGKRADKFQIALTNKLTSSADWLDSFFRDERIEVEENQTNLRIKVSAFAEEDEEVENKIRARLRFVLPTLENRFHLFISSVLDEDDLAESDISSPHVDSDDKEERDVNLSLRYFIQSARERNISFRAGIRFDGLTPAVFTGPRYSASKRLAPWLFRFTENVTYFSDNGWESKTSADLETPLSDVFFFRTNLTGIWYEDVHGYSYSFNNRLFQSISPHKALSYEVNTAFETHPCNALNRVLARIKYRQRLWRDWIFFEIAPQVAYPRENDFHPVAGALIAVEGLFGKGVLK